MPAKHDLSIGGYLIGIPKLLEWSNRRRPLVGPRIPKQRPRNLINLGMPDGVRQRSGDQFDVLSQITRVGNVHTKCQRAAHGWICGEGLQGLVHDLLGQRITSPDMYSKREMGSDTAQRGCRVEVSTREVEAIAWPKHCVDQGRLLSSFLNLRLPIGPRLITERRLQDRWMNQPPFLAFDLQHEDVVHVVMSAEALILGWSDVRVGLYGMAQFGSESLAELKNRRPDAMQGLQHQSRAVSKEPDELVITDLICNSSPNAARRGEGPDGEGCTVLRDAEERDPQTALGDQLVDRICIEQLAKSTSRKIASWGQQRLLPPVLTRELITIDGDESSENRLLRESGEH
jgi:hypothetical protein